MKTKKRNLLIISDETLIRSTAYNVLKRDYEVRYCSFSENNDFLSPNNLIELILFVGLTSKTDVLARLEKLKKINSCPPIILISDLKEDGLFIRDVYKLKILECIFAPLDIRELLQTVECKLLSIPVKEPKRVVKPNIFQTLSKRLLPSESAVLSPTLKDNVLPKNVAFLNVQFFGRFRINFQNQNIESLFSKKHQKLLAYMLFHHKSGIGRETLMDLFWPDSDNSRNSLNVAKCKIQRIFQQFLPNVPILRLENECYTFSSNIIIQTDVDAFTRAYQLGKAVANDVNYLKAIEEYENAQALYKGDFLVGNYDNWADRERDFYRERYLYLLTQLSNIYFERKQYMETEKFCQLILKKDNCSEDTHRKLMSCYHFLGRKSKIISQFQKCKKVLFDELGMQPSRKTLALFHQLTANNN